LKCILSQANPAGASSSWLSVIYSFLALENVTGVECNRKASEVGETG